MTKYGITITCSDDLDTVADILADVEACEYEVCGECAGKCSITDYSPDAGWINIECPCCDGRGVLPALSDDDGYDWEPEPPTPAAPAVLPCRVCDGERVRRMFTGGGVSNWVAVLCYACRGTGSEPVAACLACEGTGKATVAAFAGADCWLCDGTGRDTPAPFDRAAHCRRIGQTGGLTTVERHGVAHMRAIGTAGAKVTIERHGVAYWRGVTSAKGWTGRRAPDLLSDLAAGRALAAFDREAA